MKRNYLKNREYHGLRGSPEYKIWNSMKDRCFNPKNPYYHRYGGRGITVCDRWKNSFVAFYEDIGPRPSADLSIERKNNDGNYEPSNCVWGSRDEQNRNKISNRMFIHEGREVTLKEIAKIHGIHHATLGIRLRRGGMSIEDALAMTPYHAKLYEYDGEKLSASAWAKRLDLNFRWLRHQLENKGKTMYEVRAML